MRSPSDGDLKSLKETQNILYTAVICTKILSLKKRKKEKKFLYRQLSPIKKLEAYSATRGWATTVK